MFEKITPEFENERQAGLLAGLGETTLNLFAQARLKAAEFILSQEGEIDAYSRQAARQMRRPITREK